MFVVVVLQNKCWSSIVVLVISGGSVQLMVFDGLNTKQESDFIIRRGINNNMQTQNKLLE